MHLSTVSIWQQFFGKLKQFQRDQKYVSSENCEIIEFYCKASRIYFYKKWKKNVVFEHIPPPNISFLVGKYVSHIIVLRNNLFNGFSTKLIMLQG